MKREADTVDVRSLPRDPAERLERILDFVGQDILGFRNNAIRSVFAQLERTEFEGVSPYDAKFFERASSALSQEGREVAQELCRRTLTEFMVQLMRMIDCTGNNNPLGSDHGLQYRFAVEVCHYPRERRTSGRATDRDPDEPADSFVPPDKEEDQAEFGRVVDSFDLTAGRLYFPKYWYRWANKYGAD